jgi:hypothetical protein
MWHWVAQNKEWLFSGVGITLLLILWGVVNKLSAKAVSTTICHPAWLSSTWCESIARTLSTRSASHGCFGR